MTAPRLQYQQRDSSGYPPSSTMASPLISRDRPRPLVKRGRKGYQGRSPWLVRGVLPVRGLGALSSDFYGTGVAIVAIDGSLVPFTGMLTDLLAASFEYRETENGLAIVMDEACCLERITGGKTLLESSEDAREARDTLVHHWERFFLHFAW